MQLNFHDFADASGTSNVHCFMKHGEDYTGRRSRTLSGRQCQSWSVDSPHKNSNYKPSNRLVGPVNFLSLDFLLIVHTIFRLNSNLLPRKLD